MDSTPDTMTQIQTQTQAQTQAPSLAEKLAQFSAGLRYQDMSEHSIAAIKRLVLDSLGCAVGALHAEPIQILASEIRPPAGEGDAATLIGSGRAVSLESAVLMNGALTRYLDFNDVYWARDVCHPSENIPLALACVEAAGGDGKRLIEAVAVGYEAQIRLAESFSFETMGMHHVSAAGFVAPLVIGKARGLPAGPLAHAVALGAYRHLCLSALADGRLSMAKTLGYCLPSMEALLTTRLAARGFTGPLDVFEGLWSSSRVEGDALAIGRFDLAPGAGRTERVSLKRYPVQYTLQSPVEAAIELRGVLKGAVDGIRELIIGVHGKTARRTADPAKYKPANRETADHSLPCCVAMALLDGRLDHDQFDSGRWALPDVADMMARIRVEPSADLERRWPRGRPAALRAVLADGTEQAVTVEVPLGDVDRPMNDEQVQQKFLALATPVLGARQAGQVVQAVTALERLPSIGSLMALLQAER
jgi:2-methylcitrate dehydratase